MTPRLRPTLAAAALALAAFAPALAPAVAPQVAPGTALDAAGSAAAATTGTLTVSPNKYLPGQALRFQGNIGVPGERSVYLQANLGRSGDRWGELSNTPTFRTDAQGNFDFYFRAPAMINIHYRVASTGGQVTNSQRFNPNQQELTLTPVSGGPDYPFYKVRPDAEFTVVVDTTPEIRTTFGTPPPIPGRTIRLQERDGATEWRTIATGTTDQEGFAYFKVDAPSSGTRVLRARQDAWTEGANNIGWFASFPAHFVVSGSPEVDEPRTSPAPEVHTPALPSRPTASGRFKWGVSQWDFAWEAGQGLDAPPSRGTVQQGSWVASSDGTGRVTPFNGGLVLQSKYKKMGSGDRGSVAATLTGVSQETGRWEFRLQGRPWEIGARPYRFRLELVPAGTPGGTCSPRRVLVAAFTVTQPGMRYGVRSSDTGAAWFGQQPGVFLAEEPFNVAVEVGDGHVTWFRDSNPIGTVQDPDAKLGVKLVPRLSLVGAPNMEMNGTQVNSDWQRAWTLNRGTQVKSGPPLTRMPYAGC